MPRRARKVFQLRCGELDQPVDRFGVTPQLGLRQRARRAAARRIQLVVDKAAPPGIGNARLANDRRLIMGNRQHALDVVPGLEVRHRDFAPWTLPKFVIALSEVNRAGLDPSRVQGEAKWRRYRPTL